jgi:hypothetical protein
MHEPEKQYILTLWQDCTWDGNVNYNPEDVMRGYSSLNTAVNEIAQYGTIHSVSYSQLANPLTQELRLFCTVVYSGVVPVDMFELDALYETVRHAHWS